ncbi:MAG: hypothetical protein H0W06_03120 [Chloroflexia bacterium]|nr:hypothetical protein [Chloroflexia bacterium]
MRDLFLRFRVLAMLLAALGLFGGFSGAASAQEGDAEGDLYLVTFLCENIEDDSFSVTEPLGGAVPTVVQEEGCSLGDASFVVTDASDATADAATGSEGEVSITGLAVGEGSIVEQETGLEAAFTIAADEITVVVFFNQVEATDDGTPTDPVAEGEGDLQIVKFFCANIEGDFFSVTAPFGAAAGEGDIDLDESGCEPGDASFEVTDSEGATADVATGSDGEVSLTGLAVGEGSVVEQETGIEATFTIEEDALTVVTFFNEVEATGGESVSPPPADDGVDPVDPVDPVNPVDTFDDLDCVVDVTPAQAQAILNADRSDPNDFDRDGDGEACETDDLISTVSTDGTVGTVSTVDGLAVVDGTTIATLPSTGQGNAGGNGGTIVLLLSALSLVTLVGGFAWRQRRTA